MRRLVPVLALVSLAACVPQAWRGFAPKMRLGTNVAAPTFKQVSLPNGVTLLVHEDGRAPVTTVLVAMRAGGSTDPAGKAGLAALTEMLAGHGAGTRDETALQTTFDRIGSPLGNLVSADQSVYGVTVMPFDTGPALALLSDVVQRPTFDPAVFTKVKSEAIADAEIPVTDPQALGIQALRRTIFGDTSPYARQLGGTRKSLEAITLDDVKAWHHKWIGPNTTAVIVTGRVSFRQVIVWVNQTFGKWKGKASLPPAPEAPPVEKRTAIEVVPEPGLSQTVMVLGRVGVPLESPERFPLAIATGFVGGRMNIELREQQHISYGAGAGSAAYQGTGLLVAASKVKASATGQALRTSLGALDHTHSGIISDKMVAPMRLGEIEGQVAGTDSTIGLAYAAANIYWRHRPLNALVSDMRRLEHLKSGPVQQAASKYLAPDTWQIVLVGDPKVIKKQVGGMGLGRLVMVPPPGEKAPKKASADADAAKAAPAGTGTSG